jgi:D-3-phosphoglycerate dehydrogenase / 2-oxoglutarate reductase
MTVFRILLTDGLEENGQSILRDAASIEVRAGTTDAELLALVPDYDALIVRDRTKVSAGVFAAASRLKVVGQAGASTDNVDLEAAKKRGVVVLNAPAAAANAVAELVFGLLLSLAREIPRADASLKGNAWIKDELQGAELNGKTLGIVGYGRTGMEVGRRAAAFGMNVIAYDPFIPEEDLRSRGAETATLQELFAWSDFISLHLPYDVHTRDLIGPLAFSQMKDGVRLVCAAGAGIVDEPSLLSALQSGRVAGAALDVFGVRPDRPSALIAHPRVIATPGIAAQTAEAQARAAEDIAREVLAALKGEPLRWRVA